MKRLIFTLFLLLGYNVVTGNTGRIDVTLDGCTHDVTWTTAPYGADGMTVRFVGTWTAAVNGDTWLVWTEGHGPADNTYAIAEISNTPGVPKVIGGLFQAVDITFPASQIYIPPSTTTNQDKYVTFGLGLISTDNGTHSIYFKDQKTFRVKLTNTYKIDVKYSNNSNQNEHLKLIQSGNVLRDLTLAPGEVYQETLALASGEKVELVRLASDVEKVGNSFVKIPGSTTDIPIGSGYPVPANPEAERPKIEGDTGINTGPLPTPDDEKSMWRVTSDEDALTASIYREGIDKIVSKLNDTKVKVVSGGGGGVAGNVTVDLSSTNAKLDQIKAQLQGSAVDGQTVPSDAPDGYSTSASASGVSALVTKLPAPPDVVQPAASDGKFSFEFVPAGMTTPQTVEIDLTRWAVQIGVAKLLVRSALAMAFFFIVLKAIRDAVA